MAERRRHGGQLDPRPRGHRTHFCSSCDLPISVYGRLAPCLHVFCLTCAAAMPQCLICRAYVTKLERIAAEACLLISPLTLQGYRTEADLEKHVQQMEGQLQALMAAGPGGPGGHVAGGQQLGGMPGGQQPRAQAGWKPPPPSGAPPGGGGFGRQHQYQQRQGQPRQRAG